MPRRIKGSCAYCGGKSYYPPGTQRPKDYCKCRYRHMRMGASGFETETTTGRPASEMRQYIMEYLDAMNSDANVVFKFSVTRLDEGKIAKASIKRRTKQVADKLLGTGRQ